MKSKITKYSLSLAAVLLVFAAIPVSAKSEQHSDPINVDPNTEITICDEKTGKIYYSYPVSAKLEQYSDPIEVGPNFEIIICNENTGKVYYSYPEKTENKEESLQQLEEYGLNIE